jgi:hypothetical protein
VNRQRKKSSTTITIPATSPAASPADLQATIINHNPSRKGHRPPPKDWACDEHGSVSCLACWYVLEVTRLHNEQSAPPPAPQTELPQVLAIRSFMATDPGVSPSLPTQIGQIFNVPLPERKTDEFKTEDKYSPPEPQRRFYRRKTAPNYLCPEFMEWFQRNKDTLGDGMLPEDIAFILTRGEFHYRDYAKLKHNLPRQVFQSAAISYDNPSWKRTWRDWRDDRNPLDTQMPALIRAQETGTSAVGTGDAGIITRESPVWITVEALPDLVRARDLNKEKRLRLVAERENLKSEKSTSLLTGTARASRLKKCRRRIKEIDKELRALDRDWKKVRLEGTGRPSFQVQIPPCPEGSSPLAGSLEEFDRGRRLMRRKNFYAYIEIAFGPLQKDHPDHWDHDVAALENAILRRAESLGLLHDWEKDLTAPKEETWLREEDFEALFAEYQEPSAQENARTGYTRNAEGQLADETIQKGALKNHGDWIWGRKHGPDNDGTGDTEKK